jgi:cold shock CspA family protein
VCGIKICNPQPDGQYMNPQQYPNQVQRLSARVKWYNPDKGIGFAVPDTQAIDIMFYDHQIDSNSSPFLVENQRLFIELETPLFQGAVSPFPCTIEQGILAKRVIVLPVI